METCKILSVKTYKSVKPILVIKTRKDEDAIEQIANAIIKIEHKDEDDIAYTKLEILERATDIWFNNKPFFASNSYGYFYYLSNDIEIV